MEYVVLFQKLCIAETRKVLFIMGVVAIFLLVLQTLTLPYGNHLSSEKFPSYENINSHDESTSAKSTTVVKIQFLNASSLIPTPVFVEMVSKSDGLGVLEGRAEINVEERKESDMLNEIAIEEDNGGTDNVSDLDIDQSLVNEFLPEEIVDLNKTSIMQNIIVQKGGSPKQEKESQPEDEISFVTNQAKEELAKNDIPLLLQSTSGISENSTDSGKPLVKKMRCNMPPKTVMTISEMNQLLVRRRASSPKLQPQWSSKRDQELVSARSQILNAPIIRNSRELYAPLFRNVSMFKRSYELMERTLKVYVYKDGAQPIFHRPILKGIYASEGWFMKLMEGNKNYDVKDPRKAHLFYMPFSTRMMQYSLYVRNSHNRTNLALYLKDYANMIASKYSYWNRTSGADHFFVACHDWAPYETRHHMERCIKTLCNADVTVGFKIGKDVSLPETYVRSARNPLRDVGGKPPSERSVLAFFAGGLHGYLRPILLQHWENKDPDMKIFGRMPPGVASKMNYIQHMKSSKYCICAKGYEVNSPRVVEAIFYECVPVIISDNFVPPLFDVFNWDAFAVFVAEKDIPKLKEILAAIPYEKYVAMQMGVKKVQQHFLWHKKPIKYDLFHMTLHSIWSSRVFQVKLKH